jgi:hypothetical protein
MAGVRLQHLTHRNARFNLVEKDRPYPVPYQCTNPEFGGCGQIHVFKTHHLNLDETGSVIVGDELYKKLRNHLVANGFQELNEVTKPPTLMLGLGAAIEGRGPWGNIPIVTGNE